VPGGSYRIGLSLDEIEDIPERRLYELKLKREYLMASFPRHRIDIGGVMISKRPVTCGAFSQFIDETGYVTESEREGWGWTWDGGWTKRDGVTWRRPFGNSHDEACLLAADRYPVVQVSWNDATEFCRWLAVTTGSPVRLPSEPEWEVFASLIGHPRAAEQAGGDVPLPDMGTYTARILDETGRSDYFSPGFIWEWTEDWFDVYPGGTVNREFGATYKVLRGGSLMSGPLQRSREFRFRRCPTARSPFYGFRTAVQEAR